MKPLLWLSCIAAWFGAGAAVAQTWTVGPFTVEAVERQIGAGAFPNTSSNPFERRPITLFRVFHNGKQVVPSGTEPSRRGGPWWDVRAIAGAPKPALLLMEIGAMLLTEVDGQAHLEELAPRDGSNTQWQWLDSHNGQPSAWEVVGMGHRPAHALQLAGGRWLNVFGRTIVDARTLAVHRYRLNSTAVLDQLGNFYAAGKPVLALSPGGTQFVVKGGRRAPGEVDFEHALVAFDFVHQKGTVMPIALKRWRLPDERGIDAAFALKVLGWRQGPDGREQAYLRDDLPSQPWLGRLEGREMHALSYRLGPALPTLREVVARFLETEFDAVIARRESSLDLLEVRIENLSLTLGFLRPQEQLLSMYHSGDGRRRAEAEVLIERIAERFNARLAAGEYQHHFVPDEAGVVGAGAARPPPESADRTKRK